VMAPAQMIEPKDLPPEVLAEGPARPPLDAARPASPAAVEASNLVGGGTPLSNLSVDAWLIQLASEARRLLEAGVPDVWGHLTRQFEGRLIHVALENTRGRRIEAAQKLGIGRNTITRKIQELGLDE